MNIPDCPVCPALKRLTAAEREVFDLVAADAESDRASLLRGLWREWGQPDMPPSWFIDHIEECD